MSKIALIEDAIIARATALLAGRVKTVEWMPPPPWDAETVSRLVKTMPALGVVFLGGDNTNDGEHVVRMGTEWSVVALTKHVQDPKLRARGDAREIGCYEILETLIPQLHELTVPNVGTLTFIAWDNELAMKLQDKAVMIQSASFGLDVELERVLDPSTLAPFQRFDADYDVGQAAGAPPTEDTVLLPQD